jgi:hypothetical protein
MTDVQQMLAPSRTGQATAVEQARAIAEVQAAIIVARQFPRSKQQAMRDMEDACSQYALAERAFFRYSRGDGPITGPSIHLARQLASCWGNVQYGISEMRRDDDYGQSEMQAWAWDVETNTRISNTSIVPHKRDTKNGPKLLTDQRDIYENNANNASRRLREAIFAVLPAWYVETAKELCSKTLREGGGKPLQQRISEAIDVFGALGVSEAQLEEKIGEPAARWTVHDVVQLGVIFKSLRNGEIRKDEEFPPAHARVTATEILGTAAPAQQAAAQQQSAVEQASEAEASSEPGSARADQVGKIESVYASGFGFRRAEHGLALGASEQIIGRDLTGPHEGRSHANLSEKEARSLIDTLEGFNDRAQLTEYLTTPPAGDGGE